MNILLTGGAGYIGSHVAVSLLEKGYGVVSVDNYSNSSPDVIDRIKKIAAGAEGARGSDNTGCAGGAGIFDTLGPSDIPSPSDIPGPSDISGPSDGAGNSGIPGNLKAYEGDVRDKDCLRQIFKGNHIDGVIHLAGFKAVGESVENPLKYYRNNIDASLSLLEVMEEAGCKKIIFSSSATVYGDNPVPYREDMKKSICASPYGRSKSMVEEILMDAAAADPALSVLILRYFNPVGAHSSGLIGENPKDSPNNLMPIILDVAAGTREEVTVFGDDYPTEDGTCKRDYIHIMDLAEGHVRALKYMNKKAQGRTAIEGGNAEAAGKKLSKAVCNAAVETPHGFTDIFNLGTGQSHSVLEIIETFKEVTGIEIPYRIGERRLGDVAETLADVTKAAAILKWKARRTLKDMCADGWNFRRGNI